MKNIEELVGLIRSYGEPFYGAESPEYMASEWVSALPEAGLSAFQEWLDCGFWVPDVARQLTDAGFFAWEIPADMVYDMCNGDCSVSSFIAGWSGENV